MDFASARRSKCTTAPVTVDLSNYWIPQLYYYKPSDQSYQMITAAYVNTYYLPRGNGKISAFPDGLRMIAGNPFRRSFGNTAEDKAISFVCLDYYHSHAGDKEWDQRNSFFNHNCPDGMRAQVCTQHKNRADNRSISLHVGTERTLIHLITNPTWPMLLADPKAEVIVPLHIPSTS
jgi:hypothetical protein